MTTKPLVLAALLCAIGHGAFALDTDGDGLLDVMDVPGFSPNLGGGLFFSSRGIQDLDGAKLLTLATSLSFGFNPITSIESGDFEGLGTLQELSFDGCQITSIPSGGFQGLNNLRLLWLGGNQIKSLHPGALHGLENLRAVVLRHNRITNLESDVFAGLGNLEFIDLQGNQLTQLDNTSFRGLGNVRTIFLADNAITRIGAMAFQGLDNLQTLALSNSRITILEQAAFQNLRHVENLNLRNNAISTLNLAESSFSSLSSCHVDIETPNGFCVDTPEITDLILDHSVLSRHSFAVIIGETDIISSVSLVGLRFSDATPDNLKSLWDIATLTHIRVDSALFARYTEEFNAFAAIRGHTMTVISEGDLNADGSIDAADADMMFGNWGIAGIGDINLDGIIDAIDAGIMFAAWTGDGGVASVPEPPSIGVAPLAAFSVVLRRWRIRKQRH